jgi:hypothetical protein
MVHLQSQTDLLQIILALRSATRLARRLHGGQQQGDQHADDGDHHQKLDKRKTATSPQAWSHSETLEKDRRCPDVPGGWVTQLEAIGTARRAVDHTAIILISCEFRAYILLRKTFGIFFEAARQQAAC